MENVVYGYQKTENGFVSGGGDSMWNVGEFHPFEEWEEVLATCSYEKDEKYLGSMNFSEKDKFVPFPMQEKCPECGFTMSGMVHLEEPKFQGMKCYIVFHRRCNNARNKIERK